MGSMITYVAAPFQMKELTGSYLAVGALGVVEVLPLILFALYGGTIADRHDRRTVAALCEIGFFVSVFALAANSFATSPSIALIYVVAMVMAALDGLQRPSLDALVPRLVRREHLPAASAWNSLTGNASFVVGTAVGGLLVANFGSGIAYSIDAATYVISALLLLSMNPVRTTQRDSAPALQDIAQATRYAWSRKDLLGTYLIDTVAMVLAYPNALFPFLADELHHPESLGLLYSAGAVGALIATATSRWTSHVVRHGWAVIISATAWGIAIACAGLANSLFWLLIALGAAGAADMYSGLFRSLIWNLTIPDEMRGRMSSIEMLSYSLGPRAGEVRASVSAASSGMRTALVSGGLLCTVAVLSIARTLPSLRNFRATLHKETN
jgi:MFS family permease